MKISILVEVFAIGVLVGVAGVASTEPATCSTLKKGDTSAYVKLIPLQEETLDDFTLDFTYEISHLTGLNSFVSYGASNTILVTTERIYTLSGEVQYQLPKEINVVNRVTITRINSNLKVYVNGNFLMEQTVNKPFEKGEVWLFGQDQDSREGGFDSNQRFIGQICNFQVWNYGMNQESLEKLFQCGSVAPGNIFDSPPSYAFENKNGAISTFPRTEETAVFADDRNWKECTNCPAGQYKEGSTCKDCAEGHFASLEGSLNCTKCPPGQYQDMMKGTNCTDCPKGHFASLEGSSNCTKCPAGQYQDEMKGIICKDCAKGYFSSLEGSISCTKCPAGQYQDETKGTKCKDIWVAFQGGSAGATSSFKRWDHDWDADRAFKRQSAKIVNNTRCVDSRPWVSGRISRDETPTVYYHFPAPITIVTFSFRNRREPKHEANNPVDFDFVGSDDCDDWTTIKSVDNVTWTGNDQLKMWTIDEGNRREFACLGIRVRAISGKRHAAIQDIIMGLVVKGGPSTTTAAQRAAALREESERRWKEAEEREREREEAKRRMEEKKEEIRQALIGGEVLVLQHNFIEKSPFKDNGWNEYKQGFGRPEDKNYWLGLEKIHQLTSDGKWVLKVQVRYDKLLSGEPDPNAGQVGEALWDSFSIAGESSNYQLSIGQKISGSNFPDKDPFQEHNLDGMAFTTVDRDNDNNGANCAQKYGGGWWHSNCDHICLTCSRFSPGKGDQTFNEATFWKHIWKLPSEASMWLINKATLFF